MNEEATEKRQMPRRETNRISPNELSEIGLRQRALADYVSIAILDPGVQAGRSTCHFGVWPEIDNLHRGVSRNVNGARGRRSCFSIEGDDSPLERGGGIRAPVLRKTHWKPVCYRMRTRAV